MRFNKASVIEGSSADGWAPSAGGSKTEKWREELGEGVEGLLVGEFSEELT